MTGNQGQPYCNASGAAINAFPITSAREMASRNITANAIAPSFIPAELTSTLTEEQRKCLLDFTPLGRFGTPEEIAAAINFLCSPEASYITGQILGVDGGMTMHI